MLWVPKKGILRKEHNLGTVAPGNEPGTSVTTGGAAGTKGSFTQLIASTSFDAYLVSVIASGYGTSATNSQGCMDIGIGAATEEVIIPDLLMGNCGNVGSGDQCGPKVWTFPLYIPAGSRLTARAAGQRTSTAMRVGIILWGGGGPPPFRVASKITTYGMGSVPAGTAITPGASAAQGSFTQIVASTSEDHFGVMPSFQNSDTTSQNRGYMLGIGAGAATEELVGEWIMGGDNGGCFEGTMPHWPVFVDIPSGTRLTMRASNSGTNLTAYDAVIHALS